MTDKQTNERYIQEQNYGNGKLNGKLRVSLW